MTLLDEMRRMHRGPDAGLSVAEVIEALRAVEAAAEIRDKRVLSINLHPNGMLRVRTGESIGGDEVALRRSASGWEVAESTLWCS